MAATSQQKKTGWTTKCVKSEISKEIYTPKKTCSRQMISLVSGQIEDPSQLGWYSLYNYFRTNFNRENQSFLHIGLVLPPVISVLRVFFSILQLQQHLKFLLLSVTDKQKSQFFFYRSERGFRNNKNFCFLT